MQQEASTPRRRQMSIQHKQEKLIDTAQQLLTSSNDWQIIGQSIGLQLKDLSKHQQTFAQKIISDAIYYGKLEKLTEHSSISLSNPSAQTRTRYIQSTLPNTFQHNPYQFSSDSSSITPIHTPSPQYQIQSPMPSPQYQAQSSMPLQSLQYQALSMPLQSPQYQAQPPMPTPLSIQTPSHEIQASESQCAGRNSPRNDTIQNTNSDIIEFL